MVSASGTDKEPHKVTFDSSNDVGPRFSPDGRKLYFLRLEPSGNNTPSVQVYSVWLEKQERDPDDPEERDARDGQAPTLPPAAGEEGEAAPAPRPRPQANRPPRETKMDWDGLKRRTRQVTRMPFPI